MAKRIQNRAGGLVPPLHDGRPQDSHSVCFPFADRQSEFLLTPNILRSYHPFLVCQW